MKDAKTQCVLTYSYLNQLWITGTVPVIPFVLLILLVLFPKLKMARMSETPALDKILVKKLFWKMLIYALFMIYPPVSMVVVRLYVCIKVSGVNYLLADMQITCDNRYHFFHFLWIKLSVSLVRHSSGRLPLITTFLSLYFGHLEFRWYFCWLCARIGGG